MATTIAEEPIYIQYIVKRFRAKTIRIIEQARNIAENYAAQGYDLTLRQCYYQFVSQNLLPNNERSYHRLGDILRDARMAGQLGWNRITDRTRWVRSNPHWDTPEDVVKSAMQSYANDKWSNQPFRPVILIEKDALAGVIDTVCRDNDVPYFPCRGYSSVSELWALVQQRILGYIESEQTPLVFYLGDHDPSGVDMDRDVEERLQLFVRKHTGLIGTPHVERLGLHIRQVRQYNLPANPAKKKLKGDGTEEYSDARFPAYWDRFQTEDSWELDALAPPVISQLVEDAINSVRDQNLWDQATGREDETRKQLEQISNRWGDVIKFLNNGTS